jgi:hypothetical protein
MAVTVFGWEISVYTTSYLLAFRTHPDMFLYQHGAIWLDVDVAVVAEYAFLGEGQTANAEQQNGQQES